ncbi:MAG TPA: aminotransferase class IV, partial [Caulobacteraceae bacterium]
DVLIARLPPTAGPQGPLRVKTTPYARELPHLKHAATLGLIAARRAARLAGYDDALFNSAGVVSEGSTWNIVFVDADGLLWPEAAMLDGVTQQLIRQAWTGPQASRPVTVRQAQAMPAFALNAGFGLAAIAAIDGVDLPPSPDAATALGAALDSHAPQAI